VGLGAGRWRVTAIALALLLAGCAGTPRDSAGQVTAPATTDTFSVRVGDCLDRLPSESTDALALLPCGQPHFWEAFASTALTGTDYPGPSAVRGQAEEACDAAFAGFVGVPKKKSKLGITMLTPTKETWTQAADRQVICLVGSPNGNITGTVKGSAR
jgi:hypothetical protein